MINFIDSIVGIISEMHHIKSELSKILGKIEDMNQSSLLSTSELLYSVLEKAYQLISDYFEIEQSHRITHHLVAQMKELKECVELENNSSPEVKKIFEKAQKTSIEELRIFISHL